MSKPAITACGLSKRFRLGTDAPYQRFSELLAGLGRLPGHALKRVLRRREAVRQKSPDHIWALADVSFEVQPGEVLGIIGRNGAGKSTLLKILARITEPTSGNAEVRGRVGSLLEVGTGFHPELTGRENIFLNGAILGMYPAEVRTKFDEIVEFSELWDFLETPVKRYSSGMYMRLAFAVAAHLEPEILLVDEVLAVGDAMFQKKCLNKMGDVAKEGRTILFVSHNMASLGEICDSGLVLDSGTVSFRGSIRQALDYYLQTNVSNSCSYFYPQDSTFGGIRFTSLEILDERGLSSAVLSLSSPIHIKITYEVLNPIERFQVVCHVWNSQNVHVLSTADIDRSPELLQLREPGTYHAEFILPASLLAPGFYRVTPACGIPNLDGLDLREGPSFEISAIDSYAAGWSRARQTVIIGMPLHWRTTRVGPKGYR